MRNAFAVVSVAALGLCLAACTSVDEKPPVSPTQPEPAATVAPDPEPIEEPQPEPEAEPAKISVQMTSATLADDCGRGPSTPPRARQPKGKLKSKRKGDMAKGAKARRRCEQSSIQLAIVAPEGVQPADMAVKSVELLLESGTSVGTLEARAPSVWSDDGGYTPWNQKVEPSQDLSVSYALSQPDWSKVEDRWNKTYTVKAVLSIAGADQTVEQNVVVDAPTSLPPNVKT
ncbi:MAG: hypothetical protein AAF721_40515 [Myxococcota bacterium]